VRTAVRAMAAEYSGLKVRPSDAQLVGLAARVDEAGVWRCLNKVWQSARTDAGIVELFLCGKSISDIQEQLGLDEQTLHKRLTSGFRRLAKELCGQYDKSLPGGKDLLKLLEDHPEVIDRLDDTQREYIGLRLTRDRKI